MQGSAAIGVGTVIAGTYEVTHQIGRGGMGAVWGARHLRLPGKRAAIKVLLGGADDAQSLARFRREAEIASRIGHPNIVEVVDFNTLADGTPYQVLEFLDGESLGARIARGPLPVNETLDVVRQLGSALLAAHRAGVVHRDLKPENIFLCPTEAGGVVGTRVKVLDFGISKIHGSQTLKTADQVLIGTPQYMAPEQASGNNQQVDHRSDIFALGAIIYEMLTGRPAFAGHNVVAVVMNVLTATPDPIGKLAPHVPAAVAGAIEKAMAKKPEDRFVDVGALVTSLTGKPLETLDGRHSAAAVAATMAPGSMDANTEPLSLEEAMGVTLAPTPTPPVTRTAGGAPTGALPREVPATVAPARKTSKAPLVVGALAAVALVGGGLFAFLGHDSGPATITAAPPAAPPTQPTAAPPVAPPPAAPDPTPPPAPGGAGGTPAVSAPTAPTGDGGKAAHKRPGREEALPPEVRAELDEAEAALRAGDMRTASRKAQHSLLTRRSSRAFSVLTRAACHERNLANARGNLGNVAPADRPAVLRACKADGLDLR